MRIIYDDTCPKCRFLRKLIAKLNDKIEFIHMGSQEGQELLRKYYPEGNYPYIFYVEVDNQLIPGTRGLKYVLETILRG